MNGLGGLFGAEIAVRGLLPMFGLYPSLGVIALSYAGLALAVGIWSRTILWPAVVGLLVWGIRNADFLKPDRFTVLSSHDGANVFTSWTRMTSVLE